MNEKRFKYYPNSQMIIDELTGKHYSGNKQVCELLNRINERADMNAEAFDEWFRVLEKYNIRSPEKLDKVLWNSRTW
jgi:hypothetical protein